MTTIKDSEAHLRKAQELLERAGQQYQNPAAMTALASLASEHRQMHVLLAEREAAGLAPTELPVQEYGLTDAHGRIWTREPGGWWTSGTQKPIGSTEALSAKFGPLRPVGAANR